MNIRNRLLLQFSLIVVFILLIISVGVYYFSSGYRESEYYNRLEDRAMSTARLLLDVEEVGEALLKLIDKNTVVLFEEKINIYDNNNKLVYSNIPDNAFDNLSEVIADTRVRKWIKYRAEENEVLALLYPYNGSNYVIIISAYDKFGYSKLNNLRLVLFFMFIFGLLITLIFGVVFSRRALAPISDVIRQVKNITGTNLNERLNEGNKKDEIAQLAITFNQMLQRIEDAFVLQREFVSNAAHELRTPFSVLLAESDFALMQERDKAFYQKILVSHSEELKKLSKISNGLLELARISYDTSRFNLKALRIDELIIETCNTVIAANPQNIVQIDFEQLPDNEESLTLQGNEQLLSIAFKNLIDNACKFSENKSVDVKLRAGKNGISILFKDDGIGIPPGDLDSIFNPFYRGKNTHYIAGYGIGLALTQKIIELHNGTITVESTLGKG
ncbi:MAG: ATP-binding protein, partial [Paludibacter sp.]|nr:ATP-binding protein [Paludibacter sp.]